MSVLLYHTTAAPSRLDHKANTDGIVQAVKRRKLEPNNEFLAPTPPQTQSFESVPSPVQSRPGVAQSPNKTNGFAGGTAPYGASFQATIWSEYASSAPSTSAAGGTGESGKTEFASMLPVEQTLEHRFGESRTFLSQPGTSPFASQYYNSALYNAQPLTTPGMNLYGVQSQPYSALAQSYGVRSLKSSPQAPYSGSPYFSANSALQSQLPAYYGAPYGSVGGNPQPTFDYMYYPQTYGPYYGYSQLTPGTPASSTTATYQLAQLPPTITVAESGHVAGQPFSVKELSPSLKSDCAGSTKKSKSKKRKSRELSSSPQCEWERVFIWDLDETLVIFNSLVDGAYAQKFGKNLGSCVHAGCKMRDLICQVGDRHFFFPDLQDCDQVHIDDLQADDSGQDLAGYNFASDGFLATVAGGLCLPPPTHAMRGGVDWMRKLAFRYRKIRDLYTVYKDNPRGLFMACELDHYVQLRTEIESLTDSWHTLALKCLSLVAARPRYANVLVTSNQISPALVKLLLYSLGSPFPVENIYSSAKIGKDACFERVTQRFSKKCTYVVIGDGREEEIAAKQLQLPFWRVSSHSDLIALSHALELDHL